MSRMAGQCDVFISEPDSPCVSTSELSNHFMMTHRFSEPTLALNLEA